MKRAIVFGIILMAIFATAAHAELGDQVKGLVGKYYLWAMAGTITGLIGLGGAAVMAKAKWLSALLISLGSTISYFGIMIQDGKVDAGELHRARENLVELKDVIKRAR